MSTPSPLFPPVTGGPNTLRSQLPLAYVVYSDNINFHADSGKGKVDYGPLADPTTVIQNAITNA